jgi:hypothetical protein
MVPPAMPILPSGDTTRWLLRLLLTLLLAIVFTDAAIEKFRDWSGTLGFFREHFAKTWLRPFVAPLLAVLTGLMVAAAIACAGGVVQLLLGQPPSLAWWGAALSAVTLLSLFFGQQVAKDHAGANGLVPFFLASLFALWVLQA